MLQRVEEGGGVSRKVYALGSQSGLNEVSFRTSRGEHQGVLTSSVRVPPLN